MNVEQARGPTWEGLGWRSLCPSGSRCWQPDLEICLLGLCLAHDSVPVFASVCLLCLPFGSPAPLQLPQPQEVAGGEAEERQGDLAAEGWGPWPNS